MGRGLRKPASSDRKKFLKVRLAFCLVTLSFERSDPCWHSASYIVGFPRTLNVEVVHRNLNGCMKRARFWPVQMSVHSFDAQGTSESKSKDMCLMIWSSAGRQAGMYSECLAIMLSRDD